MSIYWHNRPSQEPIRIYLGFGSQWCFMSVLAADWIATVEIRDIHPPAQWLRWRCSFQGMSSVFICIISIQLFHRHSPEPDATNPSKPRWAYWTHNPFLPVLISPCLARYKRLWSLVLNEKSAVDALPGLPLHWPTGNFTFFCFLS